MAFVLIASITYECVRFITNRRQPNQPEKTTAAFSELASEYLGFPVNLNIIWEPVRLDGSGQKRKILKARSKMDRANTFSPSEPFVFLEDEVARYFKSRYCIAIDVNDSSVRLCSGEEPKKNHSQLPFLQGGICSGKSTIWQIVMNKLKRKKKILLSSIWLQII